MKNITDFDPQSKSYTGGVTGSSRVKELTENNHYQLKPSILDNSNPLRRIKARNTDRENFGEVIASFIGQSLLPANEVPIVSLVYDNEKLRLNVASKYLVGDKVRTLDDYAQEHGAVLLKGTKHVTFVAGATTKPQEISFSNTNLNQLKPSLARALVLSAIVGDHDVNPGNMLVITQDNVDVVARIDFGHALNDLLNASTINGGRLIDANNPILDFFNRSKVASLGGAPSKLWRDYPGMVPSQELVDALKQMSKDFESKAAQGVFNARQEFTQAIEELQKTDDKTSALHIQNSLAAIYQNISGKKLDSTLNPEQKVDQVFSEIDTFVQRNGANLLQVANIMHVQLAIDHYLKTDEPLGPDFEKLIKENKFPTKEGKIQWIKTAHDSPFSGTVQEYLIQKVSQLTKEDPQNTDAVVARYRTIRDAVPQETSQSNITQSYKQNMHKMTNQDALSTLDANELIKALKDYIDQRVIQKDKKTILGGYTKSEKINSASAFISALCGENPSNLDVHTKVLKNGELGKIITQFIDMHTSLRANSNNEKIDLLINAVKNGELKPAVLTPALLDSAPYVSPHQTN